jgi:hypothetical protein
MAGKGDGRIAYNVLVRRPEEKRPFGKPRLRWVDNIKIDFLEVRWGMDWIYLAQDRDKRRIYVNEVKYLRVL